MECWQWTRFARPEDIQRIRILITKSSNQKFDLKVVIICVTKHHIIFISKYLQRSWKFTITNFFVDDANENSEGSPNWELFAPTGNRFFLPGSLGPAWQGSSTTATSDLEIGHLIDFDSKVIFWKKYSLNSRCWCLIEDLFIWLFRNLKISCRSVVNSVRFCCGVVCTNCFRLQRCIIRALWLW